MTPALLTLTLARQLVALPGFRWTPGMLAVGNPGTTFEGAWCRILTASDDGRVYSWTDEDSNVVTSDYGALDTYMDAIPDLTDPATGGELLNLIRPNDRWRIEMSNGYTAHVTVPGDTVFARATKCLTLAEACARVLVALGRVG